MLEEFFDVKLAHVEVMWLFSFMKSHVFVNITICSLIIIVKDRYGFARVIIQPTIIDMILKSH